MDSVSLLFVVVILTLLVVYVGPLLMLFLLRVPLLSVLVQTLIRYQ